nr:ribonuclease H-like domain-containing protein [Tanacetum cinerariifolium]
MSKLDNEIANQAKWNNSGRNLYKLIESFMSVRTKRGLGFDKYIGGGELGIDDSKVSIFHTNSDDLEGQPIYNRFASVNHMKAVPPPLTWNYIPPFNIPDIDESQMVYGKKATASSEIKNCDLHERRFAKNAERKGILGRKPIGKPVNLNRPTPVSAGQQKPVSAGPPNPISACQPNLVSASQPKPASAGDGILGQRPLNIQPKSTYFHSFTHNNQQIIFPITHNSLYSLYMSGWLNGKTTVKPSDNSLRLEKAKDRGIVDSGCSRSMSGNKDKLEDFDDFDGGEAIRCDNGTEFKNANMIEFCGSKGIRRDYSNARTPQQNGVAERKNQTLIEAARTMLVDSLLPTIFCTNLTAGSHGATPSNAGSQEDDSDSDDKPDVLIIQSTPTSVVPIVDEATTQNDGTKSNHATTNANNLDELAELQALQKQEQAGKEEADPLGLAFPSLNLILGVGSASIGSFVSAGSTPLVSAGSTPPISPCASPISADRHSISTGAGQLGLAFSSLNPILGVGSTPISSSVSAGSTPLVSAGSTPPLSPCASPISADRHSISAGKCHVPGGRPTGSVGRPVFAGKLTGSAGRHVSVGRPVSAGRPSGSAAKTPVPADIHDGLKIFDCPKSGIFTSSSYDEDFSGPDANNLKNSLNISSTITKRIYNIHPTSQVLGDINSPIQTKSQALADPDWVEAMQAEMQQFRNQKVWVLVTLPDGKRAIGTKWILKNKRDAMGIVCRNKARLVAQGHR